MGIILVEVEDYPRSTCVIYTVTPYNFFAGSGIPCRIAFSNAGIRDIYLIPVARKTSGKLLLAEKHPFRSHRGTVLAIAPLAGSNVSLKIMQWHGYVLPSTPFSPAIIYFSLTGLLYLFSN